MAEIFLSYRRTDSQATTGRLFDRLSDHFGSDQVFRDIDTIEAGADFERSTENAIANATVVLVVIGQLWLDSRRADGIRRLDDASDYVRREIELALASHSIIIPVLIDDASLPLAAQLPESIADLTKHNAVDLSHRAWRRDTEDLIRQLEKRGIPPGEAAHARSATPSVASHQVVLSALAHFIPNLFTLLRQPKTFLRRRTGGSRADLTEAVVFFVLAVVLGLTAMLTEYTPMQSVANFSLAVLVMGLQATIALSLPLWIGWRLVGARRHYFRLLVILLYQSAIVHLVWLIAMAIIIFGLELGSHNIFAEAIAAFMKPGQSMAVSIEAVQARLGTAGASSELRVASLLVGMVLLAGAGWLVLSWRAYRDAFELSRGRSLCALILTALVLVAGVALIRLVS